MGFLAPTVKVSSSQGQTSEFTVIGSSYDEPIALLYGTHRLPGNVIWAEEIREEKSTDVASQGGKGGPKTETTTTTYRYFVHLAAMFCEGEINGVNRIWADGKLIYDATTGEQIDGLNFRFYGGGDDQEPDTLIESFVGENETPAYRGRCYIVFEDLPLANFGNRIPALTAELANNPGSFVISPTLDVTIHPDVAPTYDSVLDISEIEQHVFDPVTQLWWMPGFSSTPGVGGLIKINASTGAFIGENVHPSTSNRLIGRDQLLNNLIYMPVTSSLGEDIDLRNPDTGAVLKTIRPGGHYHSAVGDGFTGLWLIASRRSDISSIPGATAIQWQSSPAPPLAAVQVSIDAPSGYGVTRVVSGRPNQSFMMFTDPVDIRIVIGVAGGVSELYILTPHGILGTPVGPVFNTDNGNVRKIERNFDLAYDPARDALIIQVEIDSQPYILSLDIQTGNINWVTAVPFISRAEWSPGTTYLDGLDIVLHDGGERLVRVSLQDGAIDPVFDGSVDIPDLVTEAGANETQRIWFGPSRTLWGADNIGADGEVAGWYQHRLAASGTASGGLAADLNPQQVISDLCSRVGYETPADVRVDELPTTVAGLKSLVVTGREKVKDAMGPLLTLLQIELVETDFQLRFFPRGSIGSIATIPEGDMVEVGDNQNEAYVRAIVREEDLPRRFEVSYADANNAYQDNVQADDRADTTQFSLTIEGFTYNGALTASLPRESAQIELYSAWTERTRVRSRVPQRYLKIDPGDVVTKQLDDGSLVVGRLRKADVGDDFTVDLNQVAEQTDQYVSDITGASGDGFVLPFPPNTGDSNVFIFDAPLLRDIDSAGQEATIAYWAASGEPQWNGVVFYKRVGSTQIEEQGKQTADVAFGTLLTSPPDGTILNRFVDETFDITVLRGIDQFASVTDEDVLNGANLLLVRRATGECELIQFVNATQIDTTTIRVDRLLRARRGTDTYSTGHSVGDEVFLLTTSTGALFTSSVDVLNSEQTYRGVTIGQLFENADDIAFTDTGRDLKPYSPVMISGATDGAGGVDISWIRRTRIGGEVDFNNPGDVPLSEATESYEIDILDMPGGTVLRTLTSVTPTVNYASADAITDFGALPATVDVVVYQMSAVVGRGFPGIATVDTA